MSRTDHHAPDWVLALHAAQDGRPTVEIHGTFCLDRVDPYTGRTGPARGYTIRLVDAALFDTGEAQQLGWEPHAPRNETTWNNEAWTEGVWHATALNADRADGRFYARVPEPGHGCDIDTGGSRCRRYVDYTDRRRRYRYTQRASRAEVVNTYYAPERRTVRDALRAAARDANTAAHESDSVDRTDWDWSDWEPDAPRGREVPTGQHRHAVWGGGWWD